MSSFEHRQWQVYEHHFNQQSIPHHETLFTVGNGYLGIRGSFEEHYPNASPSMLVAGLFAQSDIDSSPELIVVPNPLPLHIKINEDTFRMDSGNIVGYERYLNLRTATVQRNILWLSPSGILTRLQFSRFACLTILNLLVIQVRLTILTEGNYNLTIESQLDGTVTNPGGVNLWSKLFSGESGIQAIHIQGITRRTNYKVALSSQLQIAPFAVDVTNYLDQVYKPTQYSSFQVSDNQEITITKFVTLSTSQNSERSLAVADQKLREAVQMGYTDSKLEHDFAWRNLWNHIDIEIQGDEIAQQAVRFCTYHLLCAAPLHDRTTSIGAKTLSGTGYKGHIFWDTELFMLPPFTLTLPKVAQQLLMYRYQSLPGARTKAKDMNYAGAMFPWESADDGYETTPQWVIGDVSGKPIRIWTGDNEQHVSSDIAYAVWQYWQWTGDDEWFIHYGAEIIIDTAMFWASRIEYNMNLDQYELTNQIGPDEYHENVDNIAYTNYLVRWHLQRAIETFAFLHRKNPRTADALLKKLFLNRASLTQWEKIIDKFYIPIIEKDGNTIFEQFKGFFDLKPIDLSLYSPRTRNLYWILSPAKVQSLQIIKQADVVMLLALFGNTLGEVDFLERNWSTYAPLVDHGSSLSPSIHAWVAARLGYTNQAYDYFMRAALLDLHNLNGNTEMGIHAACCGGTWQAVVFGFCGLQISEFGISTEPRLPDHWKRVTFTVFHHGKRYRLSVNNVD